MKLKPGYYVTNLPLSIISLFIPPSSTKNTFDDNDLIHVFELVDSCIAIKNEFVVLEHHYPAHIIIDNIDHMYRFIGGLEIN